METVQVNISIQAPAEKVYRTLLEPSTYEQWSKIFNQSSRYKGDWTQGSKMYFLGEQDGKTVGMISMVKENIPNEYIELEHIGFLKDGKEITEGEEVEGLKGARESYRITAKEDHTEVLVSMDTHPDYKSSMLDIWPQALKRLKDLCEKG